jgi:hypothetical protein
VSFLRCSQVSPAFPHRADPGSQQHPERRQHLSFITVRLLDRDGRPAPTAGDRLRFRIEGPGVLVATDNGGPTNLESFVSSQRNAFNGLCLVVVRAQAGARGTITVHVEADTLQAAQTQVVLQQWRCRSNDTACETASASLTHASAPGAGSCCQCPQCPVTRLRLLR